MSRIKGIFKTIIENRKTIMITAEIFWIVIFLLDMIASQSGAEIPQFVYVNF
jgi:hypothetical protein